MSPSLRRWISNEIDHYDLDGIAAQRVEDRLRDDETVEALWNAVRHTDREQSDRRSEIGEQSEVLTALTDARRQCDQTLTTYVEQLIEETCSTEIAGYSVDLRRATRLDPCPSCEYRSPALYLGSMGRRFPSDTAWICHNCEAEISEDLDSGDLAVIEEGDR